MGAESPPLTTYTVAGRSSSRLMIMDRGDTSITDAPLRLLFLRRPVMSAVREGIRAYVPGSSWPSDTGIVSAKGIGLSELNFTAFTILPVFATVCSSGLLPSIPIAGMRITTSQPCLRLLSLTSSTISFSGRYW